MVGLGDLPGGNSFSQAFGVSADGAVVVGSSLSASGPEAFRWTEGGGMVGLGTLLEGEVSNALGVSADGAVVVGQADSDSGLEAFRWTSGGGMVGLGDLAGGGFISQATGVSANGEVVVGVGSSDSGNEAFRWTSGGGMVGLGDLPGGSFGSIATDVSANGEVVVGQGSSDSGNEAFRWTSGGGMVGLGDLPGGDFFSEAFGVSADGAVIVGESQTETTTEAFLWAAESGMHRLEEVLTGLGIDLAGFSILGEATDVSADGRIIVGSGRMLIGDDVVQEAFRADLRNLEFRWSNPGRGDWGGIDNWTGAAGVFLPGETDDVLIEPAIGLTVNGPTAVTTVRALTIGATISGTATLDIQSSGNVTVTGVTNINPRGRLTGDGVLASLGGIVNEGEIDLGVASLQITGGPVLNSGMIRGNGQIDASLTNQSAGEVRVERGRRVLLTGSGNLNLGEINLLGGTIEFGQDLLNGVTGFIGGRGTLVADDGLFNAGVVAFSSTSDVLGDVENAADGRIITTGGATTTFFDDVVHNGAEIRTSAGSNTVFFGAASGAGSYTGTGAVFFEGDLRPGNSAAVVSFDGDVNVGFAATTQIELGGLLAGEFDQLSIWGDVSLDGELVVELLNGFTPGFGDEFEILDVGGALSGEFFGLAEGALFSAASGQQFSITYLGGDGNDVILTVVPEPASLALLLLASTTWVGVLRRRSSSLAVVSHQETCYDA